MPRPRFFLPLAPPTVGEQLLSKVSELTIHMLRFTDRGGDGDRNVLCDFEIKGYLRPDDAGPGDERLLKSLLREFLAGKPPASLDLSDDEEGGDS